MDSDREDDDSAKPSTKSANLPRKGKPGQGKPLGKHKSPADSGPDVPAKGLGGMKGRIEQMKTQVDTLSEELRVVQERNARLASELAASKKVGPGWCLFLSLSGLPCSPKQRNVMKTWWTSLFCAAMGIYGYHVGSRMGHLGLHAPI